MLEVKAFEGKKENESPEWKHRAVKYDGKFREPDNGWVGEWKRLLWSQRGQGEKKHQIFWSIDHSLNRYASFME